MAIQQRIEEITNKFNQFDDWEDRYRELIKFGKTLPEMSEDLKIEDNKVKAANPKYGFTQHLIDGVITFEGDSDAAIVKGIVGVLLYVYSKSTPMEILSTKPSFIDDIGLRQHLSMSRANGLNSMLKKISILCHALSGQSKYVKTKL